MTELKMTNNIPQPELELVEVFEQLIPRHIGAWEYAEYPNVDIGEGWVRDTGKHGWMFVRIFKTREGFNSLIGFHNLVNGYDFHPDNYKTYKSQKTPYEALLQGFDNWRWMIEGDRDGD